MLIAASFVCIGARTTFAQQIGDKLVVTTQNASVKSESGIGEPASQGSILTVTDLNEERFLVVWSSGYNAARGWIRRSDAVPLDDALDFFNDALRRDPNSRLYYIRGTIREERAEYVLALGDYTAAIRIDPNKASAFNNRGNVWNRSRQYDKAIADYDEAIRLDPKYANPHNQLAWLLATCLDPRFRDGKRAIQSAIKGCELTQWKNANFISTLAAGYAETGDFANAIKWQEKSLELTSEKDTKRITERLDLYKSGMPYREGGQPH